LEEVYSKISEQEELERKLLVMHRILENCMFNKLASSMGYKTPRDAKQTLLPLEENLF